MANSDGVEFRLFDTDLTSVLHSLRAQAMQINLILNEPGNGAVTIALKSRAALSAESAMFVEGKYRGGVRGGFFVEGIDKNIATRGEKGEQLMSLMGRGALALLDDAIVWGDGTSATTSTYTGTRAGMLISMIDAAQARGALLNLSYDFSAVVDSTAVAWTDNESLSWSNDTSLLDVARDIAKAGIDLDIVPDGAGNFVLSAYKNGKGTDKSETVYFRVGKNCTEVSSLEDGSEIRNALKVSYQSGSVIVSDATSISVRRRREKGLNARAAQTAESATTIGAAELELRKDPKKSIDVAIYDGVGPRLFVDYVLGDTIMLDIEGVETKYRVRGIKAAWDGKKFANVVVNLNSIILENEILMGQDINWLLDQWETARDAGLLEVSYWAAIGDANIAITSTADMIKIGSKLYTLSTSAGGWLLSYDTTTGAWNVLIGVGAINTPLVMTSVGTDIYIGGFHAVYKYATATGTLTNIGLVVYGDPATEAVWAMGASGTDIYVSGVFDSIDGVAASDLAKYDTLTDTWTAGFGSGVTGVAQVILAVGSDIYMGGSFTAVDGVSTSKVAKWNGTTWSALGSGLDFTVYSLVEYGTNILAGGGFTGGISEWNGSAWTVFGGGISSGFVYKIAVYLTDVYIVGTFTDLGNRIARYSGGNWWTLDTGLNNTVLDMVLFDNDVYVGGTFTTAGDKPAVGIAAYFSNFEALVDYLENSSSSFNMGAAIHAATASAITDSDEVPFWEDVSNALRKITWANIKATLKTYFDTLYVALTGNQTIAGVKTFTSDPIIPDEAYDATAWNGSLEPPTKNAVRDKIETVGLPAGSNLQVQINNSGVFGADDEFEYTLGGQIISLGRKAGAEASAVWSWQTGGVSFHNLASWGTGNYSSMRGILARGTKASPTAAQADDIAMRFRGSAYDGVGLVLSSATGAEIRFVANENQSATNHGMRAEIWTTPNASTTEAKTLVIGEGGIASNVTANKTLTLTATDNYTLTVPATGQALVAAVGATAVGRIPYYSTTTGIVTSTANFTFGTNLTLLNGAAFVASYSANSLFDAFTLQNLNTGTSAGIRAAITTDKGILYFEGFSAAYTVANWAGKSGLLAASTLNGLLLASPATIQFDSSNTAVSGFIFNPTDGSFIGNEAGNANGDFRYESDTEANMIFLDASADLLYLGGNTAGTSTTIAKGGALTSAAAILSAGATGGIGYTTGAGGTVTQATNKATGVTLNKVTGLITMNNAALAADTTVTFTLTDSAIAATDTITLQHNSSGTAGAYTITAQPAAGSATISVRNITAGSLSEAIVIRFTVIKSISA